VAKEVKFGQRKEQPPASLDEWVSPESGEDKKRLTIDVSPELHYRLKQEALRRRTTIKALFEEWAALHLPPA
jgi:hypothetical protein